MTASPTDRPAGATAHLRVMLVDDHELVRQGINLLLTSDGAIDVVAEGSSLSEGMSLVRSTPVDVLVACGGSVV